MNGVDESIPEFKYYYKNGLLQCYSHKGIAYIGTWPEYWAKFQYEYGAYSGEFGPSHCRLCRLAGSKGGLMIAPCIYCASHFKDYELGPGFNKFHKIWKTVLFYEKITFIQNFIIKYVKLVNLIIILFNK